MSLVSLQSKPNQGQPYLFQTHFPQPITLKPHSQVCVLKFLHYRSTTGYGVTSSNNTLKFLLGDTRFDALRTVILDEGEYSGDTLATEIQTKLNATKQQFNYQFSVDFILADPTVSPPTNDSFEISYTSVTLPLDPSGGLYKSQKTLPHDFITGTGYDTDTLATYSTLVNGTNENDSKISLVATRGVVTSLGEYVLQDIRFSPESWDTLTSTVTPKFSDYAFGVVRDSLSKFNTGNPNLDFTYRHGQSGVRFGGSGFEFYTVKGGIGKKLGDVGYVDYKKCREFSPTTLALFSTDMNVRSKLSFKFLFTLIGDGDVPPAEPQQEGHKFICQLYTSVDGGSTYTAVADTAFGNDAQGKSYVKTSTIGGITYSGIVWISDDPEMNDLENGTTLATKNILQTKLAPFRPFLENFGTTEGDFLEYDITTGLTWNGGTIIPYTGTHLLLYDYVLSDGVDTGYLSKGSTILEWNVSSTDTSLPTANGTAELDLTTSPKQIVWTKGDVSTAILTTLDDIVSLDGSVTMKIGSIFNSSDNPVSVSKNLMCLDIVVAFV